jgi:hypothetical protein
VAFSTTQVRPMLAGFTAFQRGDWFLFQLNPRRTLPLHPLDRRARTLNWRNIKLLYACPVRLRISITIHYRVMLRRNFKLTVVGQINFQNHCSISVRSRRIHYPNLHVRCPSYSDLANTRFICIIYISFSEGYINKNVIFIPMLLLCIKFRNSLSCSTLILFLAF